MDTCLYNYTEITSLLYVFIVCIYYVYDENKKGA